MKAVKLLIIRIMAVGCLLGLQAQAADITLQLVDTYDRADPFGLAFDGTHIYWSDPSAIIHQMTTAGVDTGTNWSGPYWSELAWDAAKNQLATVQNQTVNYFDVGGGNPSAQVLTSPMAGIVFLQDGFDIDMGELWISPDVGNVYRFDQVTGLFAGANPFLGGAGGYSGVERVDIAGTTYILVVNDASNPRQLCVHSLAGVELGCQDFVNQRYEGLAFDGRYLWAADYFGDKIDKFDVLSDGGSIFVPGVPGGPNANVPEPSTWILLSTSVLLLGVLRRRKTNALR